MIRFSLSLLYGLLLVTASFRLSEQNVLSVCPKGWQYFECSCYVFGKSNETWSSAHAICAAHEARLAEIENERENNFLKNISRSKSAETTWLGGSDLFEEGHWIWASTSRSVDYFTNWATGQPDNWRGEQNCMGFYKLFDYKWDDNKCDLKRNYICEGHIQSSMCF